MKYILKIDALGKFPEIDIDKKRYDSLCHAKEVLLNGLEMEEKYEILVSNYLELEEKIQKHTVLAMARRPGSYEDFFEARMEFNIRLVNLLTSARLYKDQLHRHVREIVPQIPDIKEDINKQFSTQYDENIEYRFIEELRNHVQHRGTPVHWTQYNSYRGEKDQEHLLFYSMELASQKDQLKEDKNFKKRLLEELPDKVDLKMAVRVYVECTSKVHCYARKIVEDTLAQSRLLVEQAISEYKIEYPGLFAGLKVMCLKDDKIVEKRTLLLEWDDIRLKLTQRNAELINLRNRCVISRSKNS